MIIGVNKALISLRHQLKQLSMIPMPLPINVVPMLHWCLWCVLNASVEILIQLTPPPLWSTCWCTCTIIRDSLTVCTEKYIYMYMYFHYHNTHCGLIQTGLPKLHIHVQKIIFLGLCGTFWSTRLAHIDWMYAATLSTITVFCFTMAFLLVCQLLDCSKKKKEKWWQGWDSNPRHRNDWCLKPAP